MYLTWVQMSAGSNPVIPKLKKCTSKGIRIPVSSVKEKCPKPLDYEGYFELPEI